MRHRDKQKTVFLHSFWLEKIRTNRTYVHKSQCTKHGSGYHDFIMILYIINDRHGIQLTKHHLKSHNLTSSLEVT